MIYQTSKCPYCGSLVKNMEVKHTKYGSPLIKCVHCQKEYIDNDFKEVATMSNAGLLWERFKVIVASEVFIYGISLFISSLISYLIKYERFYMLSFIIFAILTVFYLILKPWDYSNEIEESAQRLDDPLYRYKLYCSKLYIYENSIYCSMRGTEKSSRNEFGEFIKRKV